MKRHRKSAALIPVSTVGAIAMVVMAGELHRDLTQQTHHFHGPRLAKLTALGVLLWFVAQEAEKVLRHIDNTLLKDDDAEH